MWYFFLTQNNVHVHIKKNCFSNQYKLYPWEDLGEWEVQKID